MTTALKEIVENQPITDRISQELQDYSGPEDKIYSQKRRGYSAFAEMYLEKPNESVKDGVTCSICTWRGVPTIDDW